MNNSPHGFFTIGEDISRLIDSLRNFLRYLGSAWGLLSVFTPIFPLVGSFSKLMPSPEYYGALFNLLATLNGLFAVFYEYSNREKHVAARRESRAGWCFLLAIILTVLYAVVLHPQYQDFRFMQPLREFRLCIEPLLYIAVFYLFTESFTILAVQELGKMHSRNT